MNRPLWIAALSLALALPVTADAFGQDAVVVCPPAPVVSYYAAPAVVESAPVVTYYRAPTVTYYQAPTVTYYQAPAVVPAVAAVPAVTYYRAPAAVTYRSGLGIFRPRFTTVIYP
ncbi:MAG TPA: hypothetical protein VIL46_16800 [Gemmataceae bacterium]